MNYIIDKAKVEDREGILFVLEHFNMHHIPSLEVEDLDLSHYYVARYHNKVVGLAGYKILTNDLGKTTLMGVLPEYSGLGIGKDLQHHRLEAMFNAGITKVKTNADRPETILWYKKHFGYHQIGSMKKLMSFGLEDVDTWTTLETDLTVYFAEYLQNNRFRTDYINENDAYPLAEYKPLIINACLTGMVPTKSQTHFVPISCEEIIQDAKDVYEAGARVVHIHARDSKGNPTPDIRYYETIIKGIRKECPGLICTATTSGRNWSDFENRSAVLYLDDDARPDMASLTTGSLNFLTSTSVSSKTMIERLAMAMKEQKIKPELEIFDFGMINLIKYLERNRIIEGTKYINILLGNLNTASATIGNLALLVNALPHNSLWSGTGIGQFQLPMNTASILSGGHVRVGIEDSIYYDYGKTVLASNKMLIERIVRLSKELQRPIATAHQARVLLGL